MEIVLLIVLLVFLFITKNSINSRFDFLQNSLEDLNRKINALKSGEIVLDDEKSTEKVAKNIPIAPIEEEIKSIPIVEEVKQPIVITVIKPVEEEKKEQILAAADAINTPVIEPKKPFVPIGQKPYVAVGDNPSKPYASVKPKKSFIENFKDNNPDLEKFIGENLINKIGILILVLGIGYFVSYSIDKGWIPTPARVGIGILSGAIVLGVAHKLRKLYVAFSSVFVAGAIAIFYFTIAIAFHEYMLFGKEVAFSIMVLITAFASLITISYNRLELGILTLIGGFAVPFMVSTGEGNYIVLFTYILILNAGILAIAYHKKWHIINVLSFIFTSILFLAWLNKEKYETPQHYLGGLTFAFAFYLLFMVINIINNIRNKGEVSKTQLALLTANTFVFYGFGIWILSDYQPHLKGLFTTFVGVLNLIYAWFLYKKFGIDKNAIYLLIGLTLTFITLAVPIQFSGHYITLFWAGEAVLLLWLSQKSSISSYKFGSIIVHFLMFGSLLLDWSNFYAGNSILQIVLNPIFITGIVAIASCFGVYYLLKNETESIEKFGLTFNPEKYRKFIFLIGIVLAYFVGILEVAYQAADYFPNSPALTAIPVVYHLLFSAILCHFLLKKDTEFGIQATTLLAVANIILYTFVFSNLAFTEHSNYISSGINENIVFYLHYVMLTFTIYFGYLLYKMNRENELLDFFKKPIFIWIGSFFIIYLASSEVMLHGLILNNSPITMQEVLKDNPAIIKDKYSIENSKSYLGQYQIANARETILKTSFPVLWGAFAFIFLVFGIKKPSKTMRIIALSLLGLTIAKLFIYDISNVSETGKIIAFILLGVLILIISFVYQKLKVLVSDDVKPEIKTIDSIQEENSNNENNDENK
ncbi:DUF2339 domain-containing protein [Flavobacterium sp.]|uniref:DUF2339 domain-containing protein n=1 Tax=Flavobacterium sp. TaxID=239 RepID=UPI00286DC373|nr:DUF2339 domain-containing protein [Flavobacterium sp.]